MNTTRHDAILRLQQHSGLPMSGIEMPKDTLAEFVFEARRQGPLPNLERITWDIVQCLDALNHRESLKSETTNQHQTSDSRLVYAISGILGLCLNALREFHGTSKHDSVVYSVLIAAWRVQCAWDALLAGDIEDDLQSHVRTEERARCESMRE